jgi:hypothetical protein
VAAVHYAACAFERVAAGDLSGIDAAWRARRLYVPVRLLRGPPTRRYQWRRNWISRAYTIAPEEYSAGLLQAYQVAAEASGQAARALDQVAIAVGAPSRVMALAREALRREDPREPLPVPGGVSPPAADPWAGQPGPVEARLVELGISDEWRLRRAAAIDVAGRSLIADAQAAAPPPDGPASTPGGRDPRPGGGPGLAGPDFPAGPAAGLGGRPGDRPARRPPPGPARPGPVCVTGRAGRLCPAPAPGESGLQLAKLRG